MVVPIGLNAWVGILLIYCYDPSMKFLIISFPQSCKGLLAALLWPICVLAEAYFLMFIDHFGCFCIHTHVLYFQVAIHSLSVIARENTQRLAASHELFTFVS